MPYTPPPQLDKLIEVTRVIGRCAPGLSVEEYVTLLFVAKNPGASVKDVQAHLGVPQSTASRVVGQLCVEHDGWGFVMREVDPRSRRRVNIFLTPKGRGFIRALAEAVAVIGAALLFSGVAADALDLLLDLDLFMP